MGENTQDKPFMHCCDGTCPSFQLATEAFAQVTIDSSAMASRHTPTSVKKFLTNVRTKLQCSHILRRSEQFVYEAADLDDLGGQRRCPQVKLVNVAESLTHIQRLSMI